MNIISNEKDNHKYNRDWEIIKECYEKFYAHKFENLDKMDFFWAKFTKTKPRKKTSY